MASSRPVHFRCNYHDVVLPNDQYKAHCDEAHDGAAIAVTPAEPPVPADEQHPDGPASNDQPAA